MSLTCPALSPALRDAASHVHGVGLAVIKRHLVKQLESMWNYCRLVNNIILANTTIHVYV